MFIHQARIFPTLVPCFRNMNSPVCRRNAMFTAHSLRSFKMPSTQSIHSFSHNAYISIKPMIRWVSDTLRLVFTLPEGLGFISFRPPPPCGMLALWNSAPRTSFGGFHRAGLFLRGQRKEIRNNSLCVLLALLNWR